MPYFVPRYMAATNIWLKFHIPDDCCYVHAYSCCDFGAVAFSLLWQRCLVVVIKVDDCDVEGDAQRHESAADGLFRCLLQHRYIEMGFLQSL